MNSILKVGGVPHSLADLVANAACLLQVYSAGAQPEKKVWTSFDVGIGQGDPWLTVIVAIAYEVRCAAVEKHHIGVSTPWGTIPRIVLADDAQWPCQGDEGVPNGLVGLERVAHHTNS